MKRKILNIAIAADLAIALSLLFPAVWLREETQYWFIVAGILWMTASSIVWALKFGHHHLGLHHHGFGRPYRSVPLAIILGGILMAFGYSIGSLHGGTKSLPLLFLMYLFKGFGQQLILQSYFFIRIETLLHCGKKASWVSASIFSLTHLPNPVLCPLTFGGGWFLCDHFRRHGSVYPLTLMHATIGVALILSLPHNEMMTGPGYDIQKSIITQGLQR